MDFFKVRKYRKAPKRDPEMESGNQLPPAPEQLRNENGDQVGGESGKADPVAEMEDDDDDDEFFTNEVKKKLKELRKNSFMVLIPEESNMEDEDEEDGEEADTGSSVWRDIEAQGQQRWCGFDDVYEQYCERMLFFDRRLDQQLKEAGLQAKRFTQRSPSMKLTSPLRCLSLSKEPEEETEKLQVPANDLYEDLETSYVAQVCLTWEALRCQYTQLSRNISCQLGYPTSYNHSAQLFQQFQVLLQRFIENEPFEQGNRVEIYARARRSLPKFLQVPIVQGQKLTEEEPDTLVCATGLIKIMKDSILAFLCFLKMDKIKAKGVVSNLFRGQNHASTPLQMIQSSLEKKKMKLKELQKKKRGRREEMEVFFGLVDVKVVSRVLGMVKISKEQLVWCEDKMNCLNVSDPHQKMASARPPLLFPL